MHLASKTAFGTDGRLCVQISKENPATRMVRSPYLRAQASVLFSSATLTLPGFLTVSITPVNFLSTNERNTTPSWRMFVDCCDYCAHAVRCPLGHGGPLVASPAASSWATESSDDEMVDAEVVQRCSPANTNADAMLGGHSPEATDVDLVDGPSLSLSGIDSDQG
jgi:hypothetical protein